MLFNSAALTLSFDRDTLLNASATSDPVTPVIASSFGAWAETPFLAMSWLRSWLAERPW